MTDLARRRRARLPWVIALAGILLSLGVWRLLVDADDRAQRAHFERHAVEQALAIQHRLEDDLAAVGSAAALFGASGRVTREPFRAVAAHLLSARPALRALSWNARVRAADRVAFEAESRAGTAGYRITEATPDGSLAPASVRPEHYAVRFIEPLSGNEPALGFDVGSEPRRLAALTEAVELDRVTLTAGITLVQDETRGLGFLAFQPVYRYGAPRQTVGQRWRHLEGFVVGVFQVEDVIGHALADFGSHHAAVRVTDVTSSTAQLTLYESPGVLVPDPVPFEHVTAFESGGRTWRLRLSPSARYLGAHRAQLPMLGLITGLSLTALLSTYVAALLGRTQRSEEMRAVLARSEERLRLTLDAASDGGWDLNLVDGKLHPSDSWLRSLGYRREEFGCDLASVYELVHPDDRAQLQEVLRKHFGGQAPFYESTNRVRRADGRYRWVRSRGAVVERDTTGRPLRMVGIDTDITEERRTEEAHRRLEARMQQAQKLESLGVLAGGIAHDFNNLLTGVLGNADLALGALSPESPGREELEQIRLAATRAADLTRQMLAYSGRTRLQSENLDLSRLTEEMLHLLEASLSKKAELRLEFAEALPAVRGDATQIRQVVMNLITNASDALEGASGVVSVRTGVIHVGESDLADAYLDETTVPGRYVFVEVSDSGCGMDAETCERIFDPFFTTKFHGRGLGLAAVLGIVRSHQGAIRVESRPAAGTMITILLPAAAAAAARGEGAKRDEETRWRGHGTLLVVDDEEAIRRLAVRAGTRLGFSVRTAADGEEGLEVLRKHAHEIVAVLLDVTMPRMGGVDAFRAMRRLDPNLPILFSSGYDAESSLADLDESPAGFVRKPYRIAELARALRAALEG